MAEPKRHMDVLERVSEPPSRRLPPPKFEIQFLYLRSSSLATMAR